MVAEFIRSIRLLSRPLRRQFWLSKRESAHSEVTGVVLVSFDKLTSKEKRKIEKTFGHYTRLRLSDGSLPTDSCFEHTSVEPLAVTYYRALFVLHQTVKQIVGLARHKNRWAYHLCQADDLARLHYHLMIGLPYLHISTVTSQKVGVLRRLVGFINRLEGRPYEIWIIDRRAKLAYLPSSLHLPDAPLKTSELVEMAHDREAFQAKRNGAKRSVTSPGSIRVMTYNLHSCIGLDGRTSVHRVAEILHYYDPDFVALQELDVGKSRTGGVDQLRELQRLWPSSGEFLSLVNGSSGEYGIGFLCRLPILECRSGLLPRAKQVLPQEDRGFQMVTVDVGGGQRLDIINTHLGLTARERFTQYRALDRLCSSRGDPQILTGDFNCRPTSPEYHAISRAWRPTQTKPKKTWFGTFPLRHLDYSFVRGRVEVLDTFVPRDSLTRLASDHLPVITDLKVR